MANRVMTSVEFVKKLLWVANDVKTLYVMGGFGAPLNATNKKRYISNNAYNKQVDRTAMINAATNDTFAFDCVCLIKGILWGFSADKTAKYGGSKYQSNDVPDFTIAYARTMCTGGPSTDMGNIVPGEAVFNASDGHIGVYIGDGLVVECTPGWKNGVQIRGLNRIVGKYGKSNTFVAHGKLCWIDYSDTSTIKESVNEKKSTVSISEFGKTIDIIADEVISGKWGSGTARKNKLNAAGYNYRAVQTIVNLKCYKKYDNTLKYYKVYMGTSTDFDDIMLALGVTVNSTYMKKLFTKNNLGTYYATKTNDLAALAKLKEGTLLIP